jgi:cobalamin biosynthesis Co2+ chelatase CbiK
MENILNTVNQKVQDALKKVQDTKTKEYEKTQKQINELKEDFKNTKVKKRTLYKKRDMD